MIIGRVWRWRVVSVFSGGLIRVIYFGVGVGWEVEIFCRFDVFSSFFFFVRRVGEG